MEASWSEPSLCKRFRTDFSAVQFPAVSIMNYDDCDDCDDESVHSWQSDETAWVVDSGDDWEPLDSELPQSEFEMASETSEESQLYTESSSSDINDVILESPLQVFGNESSSAEETESESVVTNPTRWKCLKCGTQTLAPMKFCSKCYQKRKLSLPPCPQKRRKLDASHCKPKVETSAHHHETEAISLPEDQCSMCGIRPRNGGFLHMDTVHAIYCYACTKAVVSRTSKCPICRRTIQRAVRIFNS